MAQNHAVGATSHADKPNLTEAQKIRAALLVDVVLSIEIVLLALASVADEPLSVQVPVVVLLALLATLGVYGLVAILVRIDDVGFALMKRPQRFAWAGTADGGRVALGHQGHRLAWNRGAASVAGT